MLQNHWKEDEALRMPQDYCYSLVKSFLDKSMPAVKVLSEKAQNRKTEKIRQRKITFFRFLDGNKTNVPIQEDHYYLRGSVEYANPHLTVEEVQGAIGLRLLQACANYFGDVGFHTPNEDDYKQLSEDLKKPPQGYILPFLLNTDEVEADRYSMNPVRQSLVDSGQSSFPAAYVKTSQLKIDGQFVEKYEGTLISRKEVDLIAEELLRTENYLDFVDSVKFRQLEELTKVCGMDLSLMALRMPLSTMQAENKNGLIHYIISEAHKSYETIEQAYGCMGRSMTKRTTLLTVPHSKKGFGSKRAARGRIHFEDSKLENVTVKYKTTELYPNDIDPNDVALAKGDDDFTVSGEKLADYDFKETPSSPQFFLYSLASPEDAALWHGVGVYSAPQLLQSYTSVRTACRSGQLFPGLSEKFGVHLEVPLQFNLAPDGMWSHPVHGNIDASIGTVDDISELVSRGMWLEYLSKFK